MEPVILNGMKAIKNRFGVSAVKVREWVMSGAPIIVHNYGGRNGSIRYSCDYERLYDWLVEKQKDAKRRQGFWE